jgi:hypothetical protein
MTTMTKKIYGQIKSRRISSIPGDTLHRLLGAAQCTDGSVLPAGTEFRPKSSGFDNEAGMAYSMIEVATAA